MSKTNKKKDDEKIEDSLGEGGDITEGDEGNNNTPPPNPDPNPEPNPDDKNEKTEEKMTLEEYCSTLPKTGPTKFAQTLITSRIQDEKHPNITDEKRTRVEWEEIYIKIMNS